MSLQGNDVFGNKDQTITNDGKTQYVVSGHLTVQKRIVYWGANLNQRGREIKAVKKTAGSCEEFDETWNEEKRADYWFPVGVTLFGSTGGVGLGLAKASNLATSAFQASSLL